MTTTLELSEGLRFVLGIIGLTLTLMCLWETACDCLFIQRMYPDDPERLLVARSWVRASAGRVLVSLMLALSGLLLVLSPPSGIENTFEITVVRWGWVVLGVYTVIQAVWARVDRNRLYDVRRGNRVPTYSLAESQGVPTL